MPKKRKAQNPPSSGGKKRRIEEIGVGCNISVAPDGRIGKVVDIFPVGGGFEVQWYLRHSQLPKSTKALLKTPLSSGQRSHQLFLSCGARECVPRDAVEKKVKVRSFLEFEDCGGDYFCRSKVYSDGTLEPLEPPVAMFPTNSDLEDGPLSDAPADFNAIAEPQLLSDGESEEGEVITEAEAFSLAIRRLQATAVPQRLPCRGEERDVLLSFLRKAIRAGFSKETLYLSGMPGTGKTATMMECRKVLSSEASRRRLPEFQFILINAMKLVRPDELYVAIHRQLFPEKGKSKIGKVRAFEEVNSYFKGTVLKKKKMLVLMVDEIDFLVTGNTDGKQPVLYNLFEWAQHSKSRLAVVGLSNTLDLPERVFPAKVLSRLGLARVMFYAYNHRQIEEILKSRLGEVKQAFVPAALEMCARKVAAVSGDIRKGLLICKMCAERALEDVRARQRGEYSRESSLRDGREGRITIADVTMCANLAGCSVVERAIRGMRMVEIMLLSAVVLEHRDEEGSAPYFKVRNRFVTMLTPKSIDVTPDLFTRMVDRLTSGGFLEQLPPNSRDHSDGGRPPVRLLIAPQEVAVHLRASEHCPPSLEFLFSDPTDGDR